MERKIGEIFEYNGEWYQCLPEILICVGCAFKKKTCKEIRGIRGECERASRQTDGVIFKKLKKVGEPFKSSDFDDRIVMLQSYKMFTKPYILGVVCYIHYDTNIIDIEIKQTKEDMEEKKLNLKPFDIQKAREGKPVCTRDGRKARIICFDAKGNKPLIILSEIDGKEVILRYTEKGQSDNFHSPTPREDDLMMLPEKKEGWVNVLKDYDRRLLDSTVYPSPEEARRNGEGNRNHIATVRIEWEEELWEE